MADGITVKLEGIDELKRALAEAGPFIRKKAVRGALREAGKVIQAAARANVPILKTPKKNRKPGTIKKNIVVRASKYARQDGNEGVYVSVRPLTAKRIRQFKVARAKKGKAFSGSENPADPYYWRFVEFGHRIVPRGTSQSGFGTTVYTQRLRNGRVVMRSKKFNYQSLTGRRRTAGGFVEPRPFMRMAVDQKGNEAIRTFMRSVVPQIEKLNLKAGRVR